MKVVLVAHARSGSNSLVEILRSHPAIDKIENEPFNERYATWEPDHEDYVARMRSGEPFDDIVAELFANADGLKLLSYQLDDACFESLTHRADVRVLTLRRRNLLQTAISQTVAMTTDLWQAWMAKDPLESYYTDIGSLEIDSVRTFLDWTRREIERTQRVTAEVDALHLRYEDLYTGSIDSRVRAVDAIWRFLELEPADTPAVRHYVSPDVQQARESTYGNITNLAEIETELGSDDWGHVAIGTE